MKNLGKPCRIFDDIAKCTGDFDSYLSEKFSNKAVDTFSKFRMFQLLDSTILDISVVFPRQKFEIYSNYSPEEATEENYLKEIGPLRCFLNSKGNDNLTEILNQYSADQKNMSKELITTRPDNNCISSSYIFRHALVTDAMSESNSFESILIKYGGCCFLCSEETGFFFPTEAIAGQLTSYSDSQASFDEYDNGNGNDSSHRSNNGASGHEAEMELLSENEDDHGQHHNNFRYRRQGSENYSVTNPDPSDTNRDTEDEELRNDETVTLNVRKRLRRRSVQLRGTSSDLEVDPKKLSRSDSCPLSNKPDSKTRNLSINSSKKKRRFTDFAGEHSKTDAEEHTDFEQDDRFLDGSNHSKKSNNDKDCESIDCTKDYVRNRAENDNDPQDKEVEYEGEDDDENSGHKKGVGAESKDDSKNVAKKMRRTGSSIAGGDETRDEDFEKGTLPSNKTITGNGGGVNNYKIQQLKQKSIEILNKNSEALHFLPSLPHHSPYVSHPPYNTASAPQHSSSIPQHIPKQLDYAGPRPFKFGGDLLNQQGKPLLGKITKTRPNGYPPALSAQPPPSTFPTRSAPTSQQQQYPLHPGCEVSARYNHQSQSSSNPNYRGEVDPRTHYSQSGNPSQTSNYEYHREPLSHNGRPHQSSRYPNHPPPNAIPPTSSSVHSNSQPEYDHRYAAYEDPYHYFQNHNYSYHQHGLPHSGYHSQHVPSQQPAPSQPQQHTVPPHHIGSSGNSYPPRGDYFYQHPSPHLGRCERCGSEFDPRYSKSGRYNK
ncbi:hypothetical protein HK099_008520 [Clydaea vesicula]|uniref:Uncharacterized protein n=1 Tax=Clydaea vesicula TaxID=447962 RepID=A0AAD5TW19_9FUNG|nr:hypothetical protein HK099_008520 [Clydaea vesicula]